MARSAAALDRRIEQLYAYSQAAVNDGAVRENPQVTPLSRELMPEAIHFLTAQMNGMSEDDYAKKHPQTYARLRAACGK